MSHKTSRPTMAAVAPIGLEKAPNFISKPPRKGNLVVGPARDIQRSNLVPGESVFDLKKPQFDRGRFKKSGKSNVEPADWSVETGKLVKIPGARGAILSATWQGGNVSNPSARVTGKLGQNKSYERLSEDAELPVDVTGPYDTAYRKRFYQKWSGPSRSYGDLRRNGKIRCNPDITHAHAACRDRERALHDCIDKVATRRRRQIRRHRQTTLFQWERDRRQPKRLLGFLKTPRTWVELDDFIKLLVLVQSRPKPGVMEKLLGEPMPPAAIPIGENTGKSVNCVSDEATAGSKERDARGAPKRQEVVFPSRAEEMDLTRRAKDGDVVARNKLFLAQWPQVAKVAQKHAGLKAETEDLIQEVYGGVNGDGNPVGLVYALDKFDPGKGIRFSTFTTAAIEWAIMDYKKRQPREVVPLDAAMIENAVNVGFYSGPEKTSRTSRSIRNRVIRATDITAHISPYANGMAPETFDWVAALNAEAIRLDTGVRYIGLANRIEARGDVHRAADCMTSLGGWFLLRALKTGYLDGEEAVLREGNSQWRKELRRRAKRKLA